MNYGFSRGERTSSGYRSASQEPVTEEPGVGSGLPDRIRTDHVSVESCVSPKIEWGGGFCHVASFTFKFIVASTGNSMRLTAAALIQDGLHMCMFPFYFFIDTEVTNSHINLLGFVVHRENNCQTN